ncbi:MFS transporter [Streptomyces sp. NPDC002328]|uniref:MFS transporter n=1 Tax=Streptomyces sp. NPDC002328 TaxID=3364642 RepID=UPI0036B71CD7
MPATEPSEPQRTSTATLPPPAESAATASGRLMLSIAGSQFGIATVYGAVPGLLLALQIEHLAGDDKAGVLSLFTLAGAVTSLIAQPLAGFLSDRTRTRSGSRTPYVLGGSLLAAPVLWAMGWTQSLVVLAVLYVASEFVLSAAQGPLAAVIPDRVPVERRGRYSAALGLGILLGSVAGTVLGSVTSGDLHIAYLVVGCIPLALAGSRLFLAPDPDNRSAVRTAQIATGTRWWRTFLVSPRSHPDFWWVLGSRALTYTGFFMINGYGLYLLDEYIGLGDDAVDMVPIAAGIAALCICVSTVPAGIVSDRVGRRKIFVCAASATMAVGLLIPLIWPTVTGYLTMIVVIALAFGCFESVDNALLTQVLPRSDSYAQDIGVLNVAAIAPQILAPALAGALVVGTDSYALIFPAGTLFALLGGLSVLRVRGVR